MTDTLDAAAMTDDLAPAVPALTLTLRDPAGSTATVASPGLPRPLLGVDGRLPTVHRGLDASVNVLYLDVTVTGVAQALTGVELLLGADTGALEGDALVAGTITPPLGWLAEPELDWFTGRPVARLRPSGTMILDGGAYTATFVLANLPSGDGESGNGSVTVVPAGLPGPITRYALDLPVRAVNVNQGALVVGWRYDTPGEVIVTPSGRSPIVNDLALVIANHDPTQPVLPDPTEWDPQHPPVFRIRVRCSDGTPGYGALCTAQAFANRPPTLSVDFPANDFVAPTLSTATPGSPVWSLVPTQNPAAITVAGNSVQLRVGGVASDLPLDARGTPDSTVLTVAWENLPGRPDSETALIVTKVRRVAIDSVTVSPAPPAPLRRGDQVNITWRTRGADHSVLVGAGPPQVGTRDGADADNVATITADPDHAIVQVLAFGDPGATVPDATSVPIALTFAAPTIVAFRGTVADAGGRPVVDLGWETVDAEYCTLSSADGVQLATSADRHRIVPSAERPLAGRYTLRAVSGNLVAEATLVLTWGWADAPVAIMNASSSSPVVSRA